MSIKKIISFIILITIIILIVFGIFYIINNRNGGGDTPEDAPNNEFPTSGSSGNSGFSEGDDNRESNIVLLPGDVLNESGEVVKKREIGLRQISTEPSAGLSVDQREITIEETREILSEDSDDIEYVKEEIQIQEYLSYFIQKKDGHIILDSDNTKEQTKISNNTIPQTYLGYVSKDFSILQYLDSSKEVIQSFAGIFVDREIVEETEDENGGVIEETLIERVFEGSVLPSNLKSLVLSPDNISLSFIKDTDTGSDVITMSSIDFSDVTLVHRSQLRDISVQWGNSDELYITSKPDSRSEGFIKRINTNTGLEENILSGIFGLTIKPGYSNTHIISSLQNPNEGSSPLLIFNEEDNSFTNTGIYSLPEKCVWSKENEEVVYCLGQKLKPLSNLPQDWYLGVTDFADLLFKINTDTNNITNLSYLYGDILRIFDGIKPQLSPDEKRLIFIDKNDDTPWILTLD